MSFLHRPRRRLVTAVILGLTQVIGLPAQTSLTTAAAAPPPAADVVVSPAATRSGIVTFRTVRTRVRRAKATTVAVTYHGKNRYVKRSLETAVTALTAAQLAAFNDSLNPPLSNGYAGEYWLSGTLVANASPVLALKFDETMETLGAHPMNYFHVVVVNSRTGRVWSQRDIVRILSYSTAPGVNLLTEVRRAVARLDPYMAGTVDLDEVTLVPTSSGLRVLIDRCVIVCVAGAQEVAIGWKRLLDPHRQVEFVPAIWRR